MRKIAIAVSLALSAGGLTGILLANASAQTSPWHVVIVHKGQTTAYDIQADSRANAASQAWSRFIGESSVTAALPTTSTTTTSTTTSTTTVLPGPGYPSFSEPFTRDGDFDSGCQLTGSADGAWNRIIGGPGGDHPGTISIVRSPVGEGSCAAEASIPASGTVSDHTGRAAVQASSLTIPGTYTWEALYYLPSGLHGVDHGSLNQTKQGGSGGGCANGGLYLDKSTNRLSFNTVASCSAGSIKHGFGPATAPRDHWFAVKVTEAFSDSGHVTLWFDGDGPGPGGYVQELSFNADTMSGDSLKMDQGIYGDLQAAETHDFIDGFHLK